MKFEKLLCGFRKHQTDVADVFRAAAGHHVNGQVILVVIVDDQTFERIAYGFPPLVVLIEYVPAIHVAVFVDHQKHLLEMQAEIRVLRIGRQKLPHRVCQPSRGHIPAVRQQRIELHVYPARARDFNVPGRELELQPVAPPVSASARHLCFAEGAQIERRRLKEYAVSSSVSCNFSGFILPPSESADRALAFCEALVMTD